MTRLEYYSKFTMGSDVFGALLVTQASLSISVISVGNHCKFRRRECLDFCCDRNNTFSKKWIEACHVHVFKVKEVGELDLIYWLRVGVISTF